MNMATKKDIIKEYLKEYLGAGVTRKSEILDAITEVTKLHRKSVIRRFKRLQMKQAGSTEQRGRPVYFTKDADAALATIWEIARRPCGELLFSLIPDYLLILERDGMWRHGDEATGKLRSMKEHTVRRRVSLFIKKFGTGHGIASTKPTHLKSIIPIFKGPWQHLPPGHGQIDTVAHCGSSLAGDFTYTVNYVDAATYWCIPRAQWNKGQTITLESMEAIKQRLPVPWCGAHPDSGGEFINWNAKAWCDENNIELTRSEPGRKNDNMYIEERNGHVVRKYLGYVRFDNPLVVPLINELYDVLALYLNHFQVVRRTTTKTRVGAKYVRVYEKQPLTPYTRMLAHPGVSIENKESLRRIHATINPLVLKEKIDRLLIEIYKIQQNHGTK